MEKITAIEYILEQLYPYKLILEDESHEHAGHYKGTKSDEFPTHIRCIIVSPNFNGLSHLARQRLVNKILAPAFEKGLHAASVKAMTIEEYQSEDQRVEARSRSYS